MEKYLIKGVRKVGNCVIGEDKVDKHLIAQCKSHELESIKSVIESSDCKKYDDNKTRMKREVPCDFNGNILKRTSLNKCSPEYTLAVCAHNWRSISAENLNLKYTRIFTKQTADFILQKLEEEVEYFSGDLLRVKVYNKWHNIPRKQVSYGDPGLSYAFSGNCIPAVPWSKCRIILELKKIVESVSGQSFNFVLVNRYKDGLDHMGEHRDDEKDLVATAPIASLSLGQARDFIFRHKDSRGNKSLSKIDHKDSRGNTSLSKIDPVKIELEHGSLLLMECPTNRFWYHSLPVRKKALNVRINLTFRQMVLKKNN